MSTVVKDLGAVSAYAYAVEKGYTGTEAEFAELMADYAEVGQRAEDAADSALESKTAAQTAATTAANKASEATTAATTATNKAAEAQADADAAALDASQAMSAASTATTKATEATTAAATATSAKTDAVAANTAAQSAKTAAQTAQAGAETAAASVQSSAAQIATNTSDISELKEDLTATNAEVTDIRVGADGTTYNSAGAAVRGQISDLNKDVNALADDLFEELNKNSEVFTVEDGYVATQNGKVALAGYKMCYFTAQVDFDFYFDSNTALQAIFASIYNGDIDSSGFVTLYRSDRSTLPTIDNKAKVLQGQIFVISVYTPSTSPFDFTCHANYHGELTLGNSVNLGEKQLNQIKNISLSGNFKNFAHNKNCAWFGDSISQLKTFPHTTGELLGMTVYDCSVKGSCVGRTYSNFNSFSFSQLVTAIIDGDFTTQYAELDAQEQATGQDLSNIRENLNTLASINFNDIDYIVMLYGTNDFAIPISPASGYDSRLAETQALMDDAIYRLLTFKPHLQFYILSPFYRGDSVTVDQQNHTLIDYVNAENTVAEKYGIPFCNLMKSSRICAETESVYLNSIDHVHPTDAGDLYLSELAAKFISTH